jgi:hypothetical protein
MGCYERMNGTEAAAQYWWDGKYRYRSEANALTIFQATPSSFGNGTWLLTIYNSGLGPLAAERDCGDSGSVSDLLVIAVAVHTWTWSRTRQ